MSGSSTCGGECCAVFTLLRTKAQIERGTWADKDYIADMIIPLTAKQARERIARFNMPPTGDLRKFTGKIFTCRHWNEETRLCGAYENRPTMCRDFPYAQPCHQGCSYRPSADIIQKYAPVPE